MKAALQQGYEDDVDPPLSELAQYIKDELTHEGYKHMMAVGESQSVNSLLLLADGCLDRTYAHHVEQY